MRRAMTMPADTICANFQRLLPRILAYLAAITMRLPGWTDRGER